MNAAEVMLAGKLSPLVISLHIFLLITSIKAPFWLPGGGPSETVPELNRNVVP